LETKEIRKRVSRKIFLKEGIDKAEQVFRGDRFLWKLDEPERLG